MSKADVVVVGGGLVGLTLARALATAGCDVILADRQPPQAQASQDRRATAIARGSQQMLEALGLWAGLAGAAEPIRQIRVSDGRVADPGGRAWASRLFVHYDAAELGESEAGNGARPLGSIVENAVLRQSLGRDLAATPRVRLLAPASVAEVSRGTAWATVRLEDGRRINCTLVVAADGKRSPLRRAAGIRALEWSYPQSAIVATLAHDAPHHGVAHEHFLPSGPFAVLPMTDGTDEAGRPCHRSSLVWTERRQLAERMMRLEEDAFSGELARRFGHSLGRMRVIGARAALPLSLMHARRYVLPRLALVGDAAHSIHPIAGQGLNLGLRDVAALAEVVVEARRLGLDIGAMDVLRRYEQWRRLDNTVLVAATDGLNRLFSNNLPPLRLARDLGLAAVNQTLPLKRFFMHHAMGLAGDLPRLIRGEAL